jgi:hypothetical protein
MDEIMQRILYEIKGEVATVSAELRSLKENYAHGRSAQIAKAESDDKNFIGLQKSIEEMKEFKVDRREIKPLMKLNWLMGNWRFLMFVLFLASSMGWVTVNQEMLKKMLQVFLNGTAMP